MSSRSFLFICHKYPAKCKSSKLHLKGARNMTVPNGVVTNGCHEKEPERPDSAVDLSDDYVLTRDAAASARLNLSHYVWHSSFGYNLHPRIKEAIAGKENLHVADIGTGTGWVRPHLRDNGHLSSPV